MISVFHMRRVYILCVIVLGFSGYLQAQHAVFSAAASAPKIGLKDQLQVDYTIRNLENLRSIAEPNFQDFQVVGGPFQRQSSNISITNGKMVRSISVTFSYVLQPKKTGNLSVPPAIVRDADGQSYESNGLEIHVVEGSLARQAAPVDPFDDPFAAMLHRRNQAMQQRREQTQRQRQEEPLDMEDVYKNIFIKVTVDKNKAYVGEQITTSYKLYTRIPMNVGISKLPSLNGFWTQDFEKPTGNIKPEEEIIDGKRYQVFLLKKSALFPQQTGTLVLDPAQAEGTARVVRKVRQNDPFGGMFDDDPFFRHFGSLMMNDPFFNDDFFGGMAYQDIPIKLKSSPVKIEVLPLPENGKPEEFTGAVGSFQVSAATDKATLTTDDALIYTLKIQGSGNFKLIDPPVLKLPNGLSTYDPHVLDTITGRTTKITGSKLITYTISPNVPGDYEIPAIPFSYYDPQAGAYTTVSTNPISIHVDHGKNIASSSIGGNGRADLHPLVTRPIEKFVPAARKPVFFTAGYWSFYVVPFLALIGLFVWRRREEEQVKDIVRFRNRRANKVALKRLSQAKKLMQQGDRQLFYEEVSKAIWLYLSDKLNIPLASLSRETADAALADKGLPEDIMKQFHETIQTCETALYAPVQHASQMETIFRNTVDTISHMEEKL